MDTTFLKHTVMACTAEAPAKQVGKIARAFASEANEPSEGVAAASKVHLKHGERDAHRLFKRFGLSLRIPVSEMEVPVQEGFPVRIPHLKIVDYFSALLKRHPKLLFGGLQVGDSSRQLCKQFWEGFRLYQPDHEIYTTYGPEEWGYVVPLLLHGDKGRGKAKLPCFVFSWETCFGLPEHVRAAGPGHVTAGVHGSKLDWSCRKRKRNQCPDLEEPLQEPSHTCPLSPFCTAEPGKIPMPHNSKGHSFLTKFLCSVIPHKVFNSYPEVVPAMLNEIKDNIVSLFRNGVEHEGQHYKCSFVGCKGDLEFHLEAGGFKRSYANVGTRNDIPMCPECHAGMPAHPFTDFRDVPSWKSSCHQSLPWDTTPALNLIPFSTAKPSTLYRRDCFHNLKFGLFKDIAACVLLELCQFGIFDFEEAESRSLPSRLERAFSWYRLWLLSEGKHSTLRKFTLSNLHRKKVSNFPYLSGKGSDSVLCLMWLEFFLELKLPHLQDPHVIGKLRAMLETIRGGLHFVGIHHSHPLFIGPYCAELLLSSGMRFLRGYAYLAALSIREGQKLYSLRPKLHYFHHTLEDLRDQLAAGHEQILNPIYAGCEANEDFIGRLSRLSRKVSPKITGQRTIDRYLVGCRLLFKKHGV